MYFNLWSRIDPIGPLARSPARPLMLCVLLMLHVISPVAGARTTTAHRATVVPAVVVENGVAVVRVKDMAPMMLMSSTQEAFYRPWTTPRGSRSRSLKTTLTHSTSDLSYISQSTSEWVTDSLYYDTASDPAVKGSVAFLLSVCEAGQAFNKNYVLDEVEGPDGVNLSPREEKKRLTAGGLKYCRQRRQQLIKACETTLASLAVHAPVAHRTEVHCAAIFHDYVRLTRMKRDPSAKPDYVDALRKQHETAMRMHEAATWTGTHAPMALPTSPAVQPAAAGAAAGAASPLWGTATCDATSPPEQVVCICKSDSTVTKANKMGLIVRNRAGHTIANNADKRMMAKRLALSFTRFGRMPTTRPAIKEIVEVGALFVTNLFHGNDAAMVKMLKSSIGCQTFPTPCTALKRTKKLGKEVVRWGRQFGMRQYALQYR